MKKYYVVILLVIILFAGFKLSEINSSKKTIYVVSMTANEMSGALKNGTIDGFISWGTLPDKSGI